MVERRQVGELHNHRGRHHERRTRVTEVGTQRHEQRAEPLAAGIDEMARRLGYEGVRAFDADPQLLLDLGKRLPHPSLKSGIEKIEPDRG
ncbi:hypothetical protein Pflav_074680 [Phytohabitans flavus]|uniref:Uncharacterized protein n=1 Tax=Phytohabitans flavus TaxID=1076124 RepID=A0A6F8Y4Z9_9ACTN|nr:hypothetical protein Pflav_074680 [Phytohabitans flavus]